MMNISSRNFIWLPILGRHSGPLEVSGPAHRRPWVLSSRFPANSTSRIYNSITHCTDCFIHTPKSNTRNSTENWSCRRSISLMLVT